MSIRIAIGCHSYLLGEGIKRLFKGDPDIEIIGIFDEGIDFEEIIKLNPDIILADFKIFRSFPKEFPFDDKKVKILLISDKSWFYDYEKHVPELIVRGVSGILSPEADFAVLKKALRVVHSGELWLDRKAIKDVILQINQAEKKVHLTKKEKEILNLICDGYRNKEIAQKLDISEYTVKSHCNRLFKKFGVSDRLQLALFTHKMWYGCI
ncbi:MAG: response regulator transcription factor [Nitrospirae bacterium]|nr:response regulator transcription factor [Nitrospirota bacterium]